MSTKGFPKKFKSTGSYLKKQKKVFGAKNQQNFESVLADE